MLEKICPEIRVTKTDTNFRTAISTARAKVRKIRSLHYVTAVLKW
jgi:hypothetical protein